MIKVPAETLKCTKCRRAIDSCSCCDERDCAPPICYMCLSEDLAKLRRLLHVHAGASLTERKGS